MNPDTKRKHGDLETEPGAPITDCPNVSEHILNTFNSWKLRFRWMIPCPNFVNGVSSLMIMRSWKCKVAVAERDMLLKKLNDRASSSDAPDQQDGFEHLTTHLSAVPDHAL